MSTAKPYDVTLDRVQQAFQEQIDFFRRKANLPTQTWRDIERAAHDRAFVVAGVTNIDLLKDLRGAVRDAIGKGETIEQFRARFDAAVAKFGWTGWKGEGSPEGRAWRTRTIYQTNIATSYAAGRYRQLKDLAENGGRPYWRYVHSGAGEPRPQHKAWGDMRLTLHYTHPFWQTHYPPNGWGCGCTVRAVEAPEKGVDAEEPPGWWKNKDPRTGAPVGIDEKWDYAPGASDETLRLRDFIQQKLIHYPDAIVTALNKELMREQKRINVAENLTQWMESAMSGDKHHGELWLGFVDKSAGKIKEVTGLDTRRNLVLAPGDEVHHAWKSHAHDGKDQRPPTPADYARALEVLEDYDDIERGTDEQVREPLDEGAGDKKKILASIRVKKHVENGETIYIVFNILGGKRNTGVLAFKTLYVKTG